MNNKPFIDLTHEQAADLIEQMTDKELHSSTGCEVYKGNHPEHGSIYIVLPPLGTCLLLPFAIHQDAL